MIIPEINVYSAIVKNDLAMLKKAIEIERINIREDNTFAGDSIFNRHFTLLHITAELGRPELAQYLLDQGADLHKRSTMGHKPIDVAASHGHHNVIEVFLDAGMDVEGKTPSWYPPPPPVPWYQMTGWDIWRWCMGMSDTHRPGPRMLTPLDFAAMEGQLETMHFLLEHGAQIEGDVLGDARGRTPLYAAAAFNQVEALKWLLEKGADINMRGNGGALAIEGAIAIDKKEAFHFLIDMGADVNAIGSLDGTALHEAASVSDIEYLMILLEHGAIVDVRTKRGLTPLHVAADFDEIDNIKLLVEHGADIHALTDAGRTPLLEAASRHNPNAMKILIELSSDTEVRDNKGYKAADYEPLPQVKHEHNNIAAHILTVDDILCSAESDVLETPPLASDGDGGGYYTISWQGYLERSLISALWPE